MAFAPMRPPARVWSKAGQQSLPAPLDLVADLGPEAQTDAKRRAYIVTLPHPVRPRAASGERLVAPGSMTKPQILGCFLDACSNPCYAHPWHAEGQIQIAMAEVFREYHQENPQGVRFTHDHITVLGVDRFRFAPVKRALLQRYGLASHWSVKHDGHWSCVRYCAMASPTKPLASLDRNPYVWSARGAHPPIEDCCYEPVTAHALSAKRAKLVQTAAENGLPEPRITDLDVWALVVRANIRNTPDDRSAHIRLAAYAKQHCGDAMVHYLFRRRQRLPTMIDDIWQWERAEQLAEVACKSRLELLQAAAQSACTCEGAWPALVVSAFLQNGLSISELCNAVLNALVKGRSETTPVIVLAGGQGGEGKSMFLKPLHSVLDGEGMVFGTPEKANFPLLDLPLAKVVFLDEFRFDCDVLSWATLDLWFEGSPVPIGRPQNVAGVTGNMTYKGSAPIFITTKLDWLSRLEHAAQINPETGLPWNTDASMLLRRLKVFKFTTRVGKPERTVPFCKHCFATLLFAQAGARGGL